MPDLRVGMDVERAFGTHQLPRHSDAGLQKLDIVFQVVHVCVGQFGISGRGNRCRPVCATAKRVVGGKRRVDVDEVDSRVLGLAQGPHGRQVVALYE